jgi:tRNA-specific 2-thiouridylase
MKKIFVGLSGGVDSSVTAALLQQQGYDVTGVYMKNWSQDLPGMRCPWKDDLADARAVAARLDIAFKVYDFESEYRDRVVQYLLNEYRGGRTPNPDIMCNQEIKFKLFLETALADGADGIATGHYATVAGGRLLRGKDDSKDQTYFLYRVTEAALQRSLMPIGVYTKPEVRALASQLGLPTATKKDSQGICFIGPVGMKAFLRQYVKTSPGPIINNHGQEIGQHEGAIFYTIGQRSGLGVGGGRPYYVTGKDMAANAVYVTDDPEDLQLKSDHIELEHLHWIDQPATPNGRYQVRIRHRGELIGCKLEGHRLFLDHPASAIAPGQSAVIYDSKVCLGGGIMAAVNPVVAGSRG